MPRVKRGKTHLKRRKALLKRVKGYKWRRKKTLKLGKTAVNKAGQHALHDRRKKKGNQRALWQIRINAGARENELTYSKLIAGLKAKKIELDRKVLADLAMNNPEVFRKIAEMVKA